MADVAENMRGGCSPWRSALAANSLREGLAETLTVPALDVPPTLARTPSRRPATGR